MDNNDKILKDLIKKTSNTEEKGDCLSEDLFAAYLEDLLDGTQKEKVEEHLAKGLTINNLNNIT